MDQVGDVKRVYPYRSEKVGEGNVEFLYALFEIILNTA